MWGGGGGGGGGSMLTGHNAMVDVKKTKTTANPGEFNPFLSQKKSSSWPSFLKHNTM